MNDVTLSLVMADVDNFKNYNDTLGHVKGDRALSEIARILRGKSRKFDTVARYGGEEFAIVMPGTSKENARLFAERLRNEVERTYADEEDIAPEKRLSISCGVASFPEDASSKEELISRADLALYEAKRSGKNRTCLYTKAMGEKRVY
jgi:diguanylate cyclase (GGDEF)-like protein